MKKSLSKVLSMILITIMVISSVPMSSFAANILCNLGHDWGTYTVTTPATCSTKGVETVSCTRNGCDATNTREIAIVATAHKEISIPKVNPTCDKNGYEAGVVCALCDVVISGYAKIPATGHTSTALAAKAATCTEDGYTSGTKCSVCDVFLTGGTKVEKTGHNWSIYSQVAPTCTVAGSRTNVCLNCGIKETKEIEATHTFGNWTTVAATCTAVGKKTRTCTVANCNGKEEVEIPKLGHTEETIAGKDATCIEPGITAGKRCKVCAAIIEGAVSIPAKGHLVVTIAGIPATCEKSGTTDSSYCKDCGIVIAESKVIAPYGHNLVKDTAKSKEPTCTATGIYAEKCTNEGCTYTISKVLPVIHEANWVVITQATCTTDGKQRGTCTKCGMDVTQMILAAGHKVYNESLWKTTKAATCTEAGIKSAPCSICGQTITEAIPALGHNETVYTSAIAATCTKEGITESRKCTRCGEITLKSEVVSKLPHDFDKWQVYIAETCCAPGEKQRICKSCGFRDSEVIPTLPHKFGPLEIIKAPTCKEEGLVGYECEVCKTTGNQYVLSKLNHSYKNDWQTVVVPTCNNGGIAIRVCSYCQEIESKTIGYGLHIDLNNDDKCDYCSTLLNNDVLEICSCNCHSGGFNAFLFKFLLFFQKMFGVNRVCNCGLSHY